MIVETKVYRLSVYRPQKRKPELVFVLVGGHANGQDDRHYTCDGTAPWPVLVTRLCREFCKLRAARHKLGLKVRARD